MKNNALSITGALPEDMTAGTAAFSAEAFGMPAQTPQSSVTERAMSTMSAAAFNRVMRNRALGIDPKMDSPSAVPADSSGPCAAPTREVVLTRQDGDYWMFLDVADLMDFGSQLLTRIKVWFHQTPTPSDRIFLRATSMFCWWNVPSAYFNTILNQIDVSCAKMVGVVDREVGGLDVYFMLACDELLIRGYGYMILKPNGRTLPKDRTPEEKVMFAYSDRLLQRAVDNGWITEEERDTVNSGEPVYITRASFEARVATAKNLTVEGYTPPPAEEEAQEEQPAEAAAPVKDDTSADTVDK